MFIYTVTGVKIPDPENEFFPLDDGHRTFTFYDNLQDALRHPNECWVDMEGYYNYMVIEKTDGGQIMPEDMTWMRYVDGYYILTETPKCHEGSVGFSMG